jgi:hypothetical protein
VNATSAIVISAPSLNRTPSRSSSDHAPSSALPPASASAGRTAPVAGSKSNSVSCVKRSTQRCATASPVEKRLRSLGSS